MTDRTFERLIASLPWHEIGASLVTVRLIQARADSVIAAVTIDAGGSTREVIAKRHRAASRDGRPAAELAKHEFDVLTGLGASLAGASRAEVGPIDYTVPRPLLLDPDRCIVVMEHARGTPLDRMISRARRRGAPRQLEAPFVLAATWLRLMQQVTVREEHGRTLLDGIVASAVDKLRTIADSDATVRNRRSSIERSLLNLAHSASPASLRVTGQHGDLWPGNIYIDGSRVEVIDFEGFREGLPLQDVAYFLWYLEQLPLAVVDHRRLERMFLTPYLAGASLDENALALLRIVRAIEAVAWSEARLRSPLRRVLQRSPRSVLLSTT